MEAGDMKAMREALEKIRDIVTADAPADEVEIANIAYLALAAPPRNCDMGTAEEQSRRMSKFCRSHGVVDGVPRCEKCRFLGNDKCELKWAQMTYNESEVK